MAARTCHFRPVTLGVCSGPVVGGGVARSRDFRAVARARAGGWRSPAVAIAGRVAIAGGGRGIATPGGVRGGEFQGNRVGASLARRWLTRRSCRGYCWFRFSLRWLSPSLCSVVCPSGRRLVRPSVGAMPRDDGPSLPAKRRTGWVPRSRLVHRTSRWRRSASWDAAWEAR